MKENRTNGIIRVDSNLTCPDCGCECSVVWQPYLYCFIARCMDENKELARGVTLNQLEKNILSRQKEYASEALTKEEMMDNLLKRLERVVVSNEKMQIALNLLERAGDRFDEYAPDSNWWKDYFNLTGKHMVRTEYGWQDPKTLEEGEEILEEINKPKH
jgi:hypothetical protein